MATFLGTNLEFIELNDTTWRNKVNSNFTVLSAAQAKSANYTLDSSPPTNSTADYILYCTATSGTQVITLPAVGVGKTYLIIRTAEGSVIEVEPTSGTSINGEANNVHVALGDYKGSSALLFCDGTNWYGTFYNADATNQFDFSSIDTSTFTSSSNSAAVADKFVGETVKITAHSAIEIGDVCSIYYDSGVIKAIPTPATDADDKVWGIAVEAIGAGATGRVMTYGICPAKINNNASTTYNFYAQLGIGSSTNAAGAMQAVSSGADTVAWCLEDGKTLDTSSASKYLCVFVMRQGESV